VGIRGYRDVRVPIIQQKSVPKCQGLAKGDVIEQSKKQEWGFGKI